MEPAFGFVIRRGLPDVSQPAETGGAGLDLSQSGLSDEIAVEIADGLPVSFRRRMDQLANEASARLRTSRLGSLPSQALVAARTLASQGENAAQVVADVVSSIESWLGSDDLAARLDSLRPDIDSAIEHVLTASWSGRRRGRTSSVRRSVQNLETIAFLETLAETDITQWDESTIKSALVNSFVSQSDLLRQAPAVSGKESEIAQFEDEWSRLEQAASELPEIDDVAWLNRATVDEIAAVRGISPATAQKLNRYRQRRKSGHPFTSLQDLDRITELTPAAKAAIRAHFRRTSDAVAADSMNTMTVAEITAIPGVGGVTADRISEHRASWAREQPFTSINELDEAVATRAANVIRGYLGSSTRLALRRRLRMSMSRQSGIQDESVTDWARSVTDLFSASRLQHALSAGFTSEGSAFSERGALSLLWSGEAAVPRSKRGDLQLKEALQAAQTEIDRVRGEFTNQPAGNSAAAESELRSIKDSAEVADALRARVQLDRVTSEVHQRVLRRGRSAFGETEWVPLLFVAGTPIVYPPPPLTLWAGVPHQPTRVTDVEVLGFGDHIVVEREVARYEPGELAHIENVMPGEDRFREHVRTTEDETFFREETTEERTEKNELVSTERTSLDQRIEEQVSKRTHLEGSVDAKYKSLNVTVDVHAGGELTTDESTVESVARRTAMEITESAANELRTRETHEYRARALRRTVETNRHGLVGHASSPTSGQYRFVDRVDRFRAVNRGRRLQLGTVVVDPSRRLKQAKLLQKADSENRTDGPPPPVVFESAVDIDSLELNELQELLEEFLLNPSENLLGASPVSLEPRHITPETYATWVALYGAEDVAAPPPRFVARSVGDNKAPTQEEQFDHGVFEEHLMIQTPAGYQPTHAMLSGVFVPRVQGDGKIGYLRVSIGNLEFNFRGGSLNQTDAVKNQLAALKALQEIGEVFDDDGAISKAIQEAIDAMSTLVAGSGAHDGYSDSLGAVKEFGPVIAASEGVGIRAGGGLTNSESGDEESNPDKIPVDLVWWTAAALSVSATVIFERTATTLTEWQLATHRKIMSAYEARAAAASEANRIAQISAGVDVASTHPGENAQRIRDELKRSFIERLWSSPLNPPSFNDVDATFPGGSSHSSYRVLGERIRFFEDSFEWDYLQYEPGAYFWDPSWQDRINASDPDPNLQSFLRSPIGRCVLSVRPGAESRVLEFLSTGSMWDDQAPFSSRGPSEELILANLIPDRSDEWEPAPFRINVTQGDKEATVFITARAAHFASTLEGMFPSAPKRPSIQGSLARIKGEVFTIESDSQASTIVLDRTWPHDSESAITFELGPKPVGAPWEETVPTSLIWLDGSDPLPNLDAERASR